MTFLTAKELSDLIVDADQCPDDMRSILVSRIRRFEADRLIKAAEEKRDDRGTHQFDEVAACTARVLSLLTDFGFDRPLLQQAVYMIAPPASGVVNDGVSDTPYWDHPEAEARHIKNLPEVILGGSQRIIRLWWHIQFGKISISGRICDPQDKPSKLGWFYDMQEIKRVGSLEIPLNELCAPIIAHYRNA